MNHILTKETFRVKLASSLKTHMIVFDLHFDCDNSAENRPSQSSTSTTALLNFSKILEKTEQFGGVIYCWRNILNFSFNQREGVVLNSRLIFANVLQFFAVLTLIFFIPDRAFTALPKLFPTTIHQDEKCPSQNMTFHPDKCIFQKVDGYSTGTGVCSNVQLDYQCISENIRYLNDSGGNSVLKSLCHKINELLSGGSNELVSLLYQYNHTIDEFVEVLATKIISVSLCSGLGSFNTTLWSTLQENNSLNVELCNVPHEDFCLKTEEITSGTTVVNATPYFPILESYKVQFRSALKSVIDCTLKTSDYDMTIVNEVLRDALNNLLHDTLLKTGGNSWKLAFSEDLDAKISDLPMENYLNEWFKNYIDEALVNNFTSDKEMYNTSSIISGFSVPILIESSPKVITQVAMEMVDEVFVGLEMMIDEVVTALYSDMQQIPNYLSMDIPIDEICKNIWEIIPTVNILVNSVTSSEDNSCQAQLSGCLDRTGICLIGVDQRESSLPVPFQFIGEGCSKDHYGLQHVMQTKERLGIIDSILPTSETM